MVPRRVKVARELGPISEVLLSVVVVPARQPTGSRARIDEHEPAGLAFDEGGPLLAEQKPLAGRGSVTHRARRTRVAERWRGCMGGPLRCLDGVRGCHGSIIVVTAGA